MVVILVLMVGGLGMVVILELMVGSLGMVTLMGPRTVARRYTHTTSNQCISTYYKKKYREQAAVSGYYQAAKNLRKQGVPLDIARQILFID